MDDSTWRLLLYRRGHRRTQRLFRVPELLRCSWSVSIQPSRHCVDRQSADMGLLRLWSRLRLAVGHVRAAVAYGARLVLHGSRHHDGVHINQVLPFHPVARLMLSYRHWSHFCSVSGFSRGVAWSLALSCLARTLEA